MAWRDRIANVFRPDALSRELDDELEFHIAELTDELIESGLDPEEARRQARCRFGPYSAQKEEARGMDIVRSLETLLGDLRYGARQLRLNPGFAAVAILSLGLGIGANSAIFQLITALRLKSLPVSNPEELVAVTKAPNFLNSGWYSGRNAVFTYAQVKEMQQRQEAFSGLLAFGTREFNLSRGGEARFAEGLYVTPNFLDVLGVAPLLGAWLPSDADPEDCSGAGAMLGYGFWQSEMGGDPEAIGRDIYLSGRTFPILAVAPPGFTGLEPERRFDVALPVCADGVMAGDGKGRLANMTAWWLTPIGRLKPGWTVERAASHLHQISPGIFRATQPSDYRPETLDRYLDNKLSAESARSGVSSLRRQYGNPLWVLLASTGLVLAIACANLANLLLARASVRKREVALRQAVGASRGRLVAQLMAESALLAVSGALLGGVIASMGSQAMVAFLNQGDGQFSVPLGVDWRVFGFTAALALGACLMFGLTPALRAASAAPAGAMRGGRGAGHVESHGLRQALVVAQIALSLILMVGALLFGQSLRNLLQAETGIEADGVLLAGVSVSLSDLGSESERRWSVFRQVEERIRALPGVESAAAVFMTPFSGNGWAESMHADDDPAPTGGKSVWLNRVGPGYFETMKTPLFAGRDFTPYDNLSAPRVAIINQKMARELFGDADPIGRSFRYEANAGDADPTFQIVGLVRNTKYNNLREEDRPIAFLPAAQDEEAPDELTFAVRVRGSLPGSMDAVRELVSEIDPGMLIEFRVLDLEVSQSILRERLMANLSGGFGLLAALLSTLGLYGVMSYMVAKKRGEIGVRLALGAGRGDIRRLVFGEAGRLLIAGLGLGLAGSFALSRYAESMLFGLEPNDALTLTLACALLAATAAAATQLPVRRAMNLDPATVLRDD